MRKLLIATQKELRLLLRDRIGLLVLFVMPALLVLVITLVQDNVTQAVGDTRMEILLVDDDHSDLGAALSKLLSNHTGVVITTTLNGHQPERQAALDMVTRGAFSICLIIPEGLRTGMAHKARKSARKSLSLSPLQDSGKTTNDTLPLELYFDPTLPANFRSAVKNMLQLAMLDIESKARFRAINDTLPLAIEKALSEKLSSMAPATIPEEEATFDFSPTDIQPLMKLTEIGSTDSMGKNPNAVQQNVPAWSLFGVFFIVLPMAGAFVKERLYGLDQRLRVLPVSYLTIVAGKVLAYVLAGLAQFALMVAIGVWGLPVFGLPAFEIVAPEAGIAVALCAILAATGYGILLGTALKTYEQASVFGPISIVIASAIGGIMVPVWAMPDMMRPISALSPLCWGQNAFVGLLIRGEPLSAVAGNLIRLLAFTLACILLAWIIDRRRNRGHGRTGLA